MRNCVSLALVAAMLAFCAWRLEFGTDITHFMPEGEDGSLAAVARSLADSELTRTLVICVGAPELSVAVAAIRELAEKLADLPEVASLRTGFDPLETRALYDLYFPRRHYYLSDDPERELPPRFAPGSLAEQAEHMREQLASPASTLLERLIPADPLGAFPAILARLAADRPELDLEDGVFVARESGFAVMLLRTHASAFASGPQGRLQREIQRAFAAISVRYGERLVLEQSGASRFAVSAEERLRSDFYLIGACSFLGVAGLFLLFFRSLARFGLAIAPPAIGILAATTAGLLVFGELDGLTLVFATSLLGVSIDYSIHLLNRHALAGATPVATTVARLRSPLALGALTTMASFVGLGLTRIPALREIAFVAVVGIGVALLATLYLLPGWLPAPRVPQLSAAVAAKLARSLLALAPHRRALAIVPLLGLLLGTFALPRLYWVDDLTQLGHLDPKLVAEDHRVRERVSTFDSGRVVVALAAGPEAALALNDSVYSRLLALVRAGKLEGLRSLHSMLWSSELAQRNLVQLRAIPDLYQRVEHAYIQAGFRPGTLEPFREALVDEPPPPLRLADLENTPLAELTHSLVMPLGERTGVLTYLRGARSSEAVRGALAGLDGVYLFEQGDFINRIYREFRLTMLRQMAIGSVLVVLVLLLRYRAWRPTVAAFLPSLLVVVLLLSCFALLGVEVNLLHATSLLMVMGMGVDYGIFMVDSVEDRSHLGATLLSLLLSCGTTVFVFGTLALSSHPALRAMGLTTGVGILLSALLAPITLVMLQAVAPTRT